LLKSVKIAPNSVPSVAQSSIVAKSIPREAKAETAEITTAATATTTPTMQEHIDSIVYKCQNEIIDNTTLVKWPWQRIREDAKLPDNFRFHGLRHHFASTLASNGVDLYTIQKLLTHKDASTTQRYAHLSDQTLRDAVNLSDKLIESKTKAEIINLGVARNG